jgi:DNA (cytosine-5)-methyltransferase 1
MSRTNKKQLLAIDLFSGAGGFSEGLESCGIKVILAQELHPQPALTLAFNHIGTSVIVGDIRNLELETMKEVINRKYTGELIDIVVGGPPCQGFSTAGKKDENDKRNNLFKYFCNVVSEFYPKVIILENVPGFKKLYGGRIYQEALVSFQELGYNLKDDIVNAVGFGIPQRRQRFVMVGVRKDLNKEFQWPDATHQDPEKAADLFSMHKKSGATVFDAISDLEFVQPGYEGHAYKTEAISDFEKERRSQNGRVFNHLATRHREKAVKMFSYISEGSTINSVPPEFRSSKRTMARLDRNKISNTVLALPDDLIHYSQDRIPTVREMARLQTFDDDFVFLGKRTSGFVDRKVDVPQYTQVGNAVPPLLAKAIGLKVVEMLGVAPTDIRNKAIRVKRHEWLRGSSGYTGYALSDEAQLEIFDIFGTPIDLPIDMGQPKTTNLPSLVEWKENGKTGSKRQWAPGVKRVRGERRSR